MKNPTITAKNVDDLGYGLLFKDGELKEQLITGEAGIRQWFDLMLRQRPGLTPIYNYDSNPPGIDIIKLYDHPYHIMTAEIQRHIENTAAYNPAVRSVDSFTFSKAGRRLTVEFAVHLRSGSEVEITYDV